MSLRHGIEELMGFVAAALREKGEKP